MAGISDVAQKGNADATEIRGLTRRFRFTPSTRVRLFAAATGIIRNASNP